MGEKVLRDALNNKIVEGFSIKTNQAMHYYHADDQFCEAPLSNTLRNRMQRAPSNMTEDTIGLLLLVPGMKVMVTDNVAMRGGVANRCLGTVQDIKYELNSYGQRRAICAYVQVPGAKIQAPGLPPDVIPILPETIMFKYKMEGDVTYSIRRTQLSLLPAYAFTVNKIQGQSLQYVLVDLRSTWGTQTLYVMISRAVSLENLAVMRWFPSTNLDQRLSPAYWKEFDRLKTLDEWTTAEFKQRRWRRAMVRLPIKPRDVLQPHDFTWSVNIGIFHTGFENRHQGSSFINVTDRYHEYIVEGCRTGWSEHHDKIWCQCIRCRFESSTGMFPHTVVWREVYQIGYTRACQ